MRFLVDIVYHISWLVNSESYIFILRVTNRLCIIKMVHAVKSL